MSENPEPTSTPEPILPPPNERPGTPQQESPDPSTILPRPSERPGSIMQGGEPRADDRIFQGPIKKK